VSNFLRRLPLSRLLALCAAALVLGSGATALAVAIGTGPVPPPKPLAQAVHDALAAGAGGQQIEGVSARIQLTDHLLEGANLASQTGAGGGGGLASNPLVTGASGRLWISNDGRIRVELQSESGDTQILYDGHTVTLYDAATNSLYRYTVPASTQSSASSGESSSGASSSGESSSGASSSGESSSGASSSGASSSGASSSGESSSSGKTGSGETGAGSGDQAHKIPTVAEIQEAIEHVMRHANLTGATPTDVAGQAAYSVRISPSHNGGLVGGVELAWDADHGVPLRLAVYSTETPAPVLELAATEISYGPVESSIFEFSPPANAKVTEIQPHGEHEGSGGKSSKPNITHQSGLQAAQAALPFTLDAPASLAGMPREEVQGVEVNGHAAALIGYGQGLGGIAVVESQAKSGSGGEGGSGNGEGGSSELLGELPKVPLPGASASELPTPLGTLLSFKRGGIDYLLAGSVTPATLQSAAKGL
jgi:outer membrane lipoprotein-sorting protein